MKKKIHVQKKYLVDPWYPHLCQFDNLTNLVIEFLLSLLPILFLRLKFRLKQYYDSKIGTDSNKEHFSYVVN